MGPWEHRYLGRDRFPDPSTPIEIEQPFTIDPTSTVPHKRWRRHNGLRHRFSVLALQPDRRRVRQVRSASALVQIRRQGDAGGLKDAADLAGDGSAGVM